VEINIVTIYRTTNDTNGNARAVFVLWNADGFGREVRRQDCAGDGEAAVNKAFGELLNNGRLTIILPAVRVTPKEYAVWRKVAK